MSEQETEMVVVNGVRYHKGRVPESAKLAEKEAALVNKARVAPSNPSSKSTPADPAKTAKGAKGKSEDEPQGDPEQGGDK